jgi:hypothetical protein
LLVIIDGSPVVFGGTAAVDSDFTQQHGDNNVYEIVHRP